MEIDLKQLLDAYSVLGRIADQFYEPSSAHWNTLLDARKLLAREMHGDRHPRAHGGRCPKSQESNFIVSKFREYVLNSAFFQS